MGLQMSDRHALTRSYLPCGTLATMALIASCSPAGVTQTRSASAVVMLPRSATCVPDRMQGKEMSPLRLGIGLGPLSTPSHTNREMERSAPAPSSVPVIPASVDQRVHTTGNLTAAVTALLKSWARVRHPPAPIRPVAQ